MAIGDGKAKKEAQDIKEELSFVLDAVSSIGDKLVASFEEAVDAAGDLNGSVEVVNKTLKRGIVADTKAAVKNTEDLIKANVRQQKGLLKQGEVEKLKTKLLETQVLFETRKEVAARNGVALSEEEVKAFEDQLKVQEEILDNIDEQEKSRLKSIPLSKALTKNLAEGANKIDKSGILAGILEGNLKDVVTVSRLGELAVAAIAAAALSGSKNMAKLSQTTGISKDAAKDLQKSLNASAISSENVAFTGEKATKAFVALSKETGLVADFGGQTLETFTMLTTKLGLAEDAASSLTTMARLQGKETEKVLSDTVDTASSIAKQAGVAVNVKGVLEDVASVSNSIKVSLGSNPELLAEAATNAALLGTNLEGVDAIASSLLDFEQSIKNELAAEMLLGKDINLEKARQLALTNDLAGLAEEIANQEEITAAFATGNRIEQEAAAAAIGMSRDALADMVMKQQLNALSAEEFKNTYGEATYEQMQSVDAQEKLALAFGKVKDSVAQIGLAFAPILDQVAKFVAFIFSAKETLVLLGGILAGLAARQAILAAISLKKSIFEIFAGNSKFGPVGIAASIAGVAAMMALANTETVDDAVIPPGYGSRIMSGPKGSIAFNDDDTIVAGTNLGGGGNNMKETNALLSDILNKQGTVKMNATSVGTAFSVNSRQIQ